MKNTEFIIRKRSGAYKPTAKEVRNWKKRKQCCWYDKCQSLPPAINLLYYTIGIHLSTGPAPPRFRAIAACLAVCVDLWAAMNFRDVSVTVDPWDGTLISSSFPSWVGPWHSAKLSPIFSSFSHFGVWFLSHPFLAAAWNLVPTGCSSRQHTLLFFF